MGIDENEIRFEAITKKEDGYFVEYKPPLQSNFACLSIIIIREFNNKQLVIIAEKELERWLSKYPIPIRLTLLDNKDNHIALGEPYNSKYLYGSITNDGSIIKSSNDDDFTNFIKIKRSDEELKLIYKDISYKTGKQMKESADKDPIKTRKINRMGNFIVLFWFSVIPAAWATVEFLGPFWLSIIVYVYSLYKAFENIIKRFLKIKPSQLKQQKEQEERQKEHHHDHCKLNPEGFLKLKQENEEKLRLDENIKKYQSLK